MAVYEALGLFYEAIVELEFEGADDEALLLLSEFVATFYHTQMPTTTPMDYEVQEVVLATIQETAEMAQWCDTFFAATLANKIDADTCMLLYIAMDTLQRASPQPKKAYTYEDVCEYMQVESAPTLQQIQQAIDRNASNKEFTTAATAAILRLGLPSAANTGVPLYPFYKVADSTIDLLKLAKRIRTTTNCSLTKATEDAIDHIGLKMCRRLYRTDRDNSSGGDFELASTVIEHIMTQSIWKTIDDITENAVGKGRVVALLESM